ncbi:hypothetical protein A374_15938 [Fictibacillus macauensis ZFHKF-1]|uniref:Uncharacterized protein n=1 Tax=Fictibacillus macauensis ZFHKF-1 TaxID=1196324 RepID=I8AF85_9BACL|nr:hypothetical protein [Fictibacillus macauensis]EIT84292.1 hypothetical protein A374_15938 [Fictibacillus macauensis ZFHKF-1]
MKASLADELKPNETVIRKTTVYYKMEAGLSGNFPYIRGELAQTNERLLFVSEQPPLTIEVPLNGITRIAENKEFFAIIKTLRTFVIWQERLDREVFTARGEEALHERLIAFFEEVKKACPALESKTK